MENISPARSRERGICNGAPAKAALSFCGERTSKEANAVFAAGGNGVSGLCEDEVGEEPGEGYL